MKIDWLKPLLGTAGPFATVFLDVTRDGDAGEREVENRWRGVVRSLVRDGAPQATVDLLEQAVMRPTHVRGPHAKVVVANDDGVLVDRVVGAPPATPVASYGPVPVLLPAGRAAEQSVDRLVVVVDRTGADLRWSRSGPDGIDQGAETVEGDHDEVSKAAVGGTAQRRVEARAEDSWGRNAETVARRVEASVAERRPEVVILTGDVRAAGLVKAALGRPVLALVRDVPGGVRGEAPSAAFTGRCAEVVDEVRTARRAVVLDALREGQGRASGGVSSLEDVVAVLARGQVAELVLGDELLATAGDGQREVWVGPSPLHVGTSREAIAEMGVEDEIHRYPVGVALVRAALGQDAGVTFAPAGSVALTDGVGAVLRWTDDGTPSESAVSMSGDSRRLHEL
ncbi:hypothetical protein CLV28_0012 [Sediminihabitans luteus]|uniref:Peptide subunit release factor 1 (ERF1) n=1 Tax=Sediminihabitans luteus TaxID=1138585 RepID=A0A2M9CY08_9CELL|nr:Vms1/Ankzf1 family peptidyl-tRNA hydrolase [Sediminihabitans luteus]PJJ76811.1 hypothetical protein CLV28_0012 [Sediminihabitans luteus]GIJ00289.1 hypothetical protein Slu03_26660 [Sediminihabitans luteus]